jgi:hypothetical protein
MHHQVATFRIGVLIVDLPARRARGVPQFYSDVKGACSVVARRILGRFRLSLGADSLREAFRTGAAADRRGSKEDQTESTAGRMRNAYCGLGALSGF